MCNLPSDVLHRFISKTMPNFQWLTYDRKQVLLLDFSEHPAKRIEQLAREVQQIITAQPPGSVLVLADFTGASITGDALRAIAKAAAADRRYVSRAAWVGANLSEERFRAFQDAAGREIHRFPSREEALRFLTSD